jgi:hypothetical protein
MFNPITEMYALFMQGNDFGKTVILLGLMGPIAAACSRSLALLFGIPLGLLGISLFMLSASVPQKPGDAGGLVAGILMYGAFYWGMYFAGAMIRQSRMDPASTEASSAQK